MCLYQIDLDDEKCEVYLYPGDVGSTVNFINLKDVVRDTIQETSTLLCECLVLCLSSLMKYT